MKYVDYKGSKFFVHSYKDEQEDDSQVEEESKSNILKGKIESFKCRRGEILREIASLIPDNKRDKMEDAFLKKLLNDLDRVDEDISEASDSLLKALEEEKRLSQDVSIAYGTYLPLFSTGKGLGSFVDIDALRDLMSKDLENLEV